MDPSPLPPPPSTEEDEGIQMSTTNNPDLSTLSPSEQDTLTIKQTEEIEREITATSPHPIHPAKYPLPTLLLPLYTNDPIYTKKIGRIGEKYGTIRATRPDGNCFYRAVLWTVFEKGMKEPGFLERMKQRWVELKEELKAAGYTQFTVEDFWENWGEALNTLSTLNNEDSTLFSTHFESAPTCDYLTVFLRIITAAELTKNADFYMNFLTTHDSIGEFVKLEVEPMGKEADNIQIIALSTALGIGIRVVYLDNRGEEVVEHEFPEGKGEYEVTLLYRPGHYDVIYL